MSHAAIPTQFSIKYWHDKTLHSQGWWRLLPLAGLVLAAMAMALIWAGKALIEAFNNYREAQKADAALDSFRAAVDPSYKKEEVDYSWVKDAIKAGLADTPESDESHQCTCFAGMSDRPGAQCEVHGRYY